MSATLTWVDAIGAGVLGNLVQIPVERFDGWTPDVAMIGDRVYGLGTGIPYSFEFRSDDLVSFRIDNLKGSDLAMARRLKIHLLRGGEVGVSATNELADLFASATIAPDTMPQISEPTRENREYSFSCTLRSGTGSFVPTETGRRGGVDYSLFGLARDWDADALIGIVPDGSQPSAFIEVIAGDNAVQADSTHRPTFIEDALNGHAALEFIRGAGGASVMKSPVIGNPSLGSTIFLVATALGFPSGGKHNFLNFHSAGFEQSIYKDGLVDGVTLFSASGSGDILGTVGGAWFILALVLDPVAITLTPWINGVEQTPIPSIYAGWGALKELWFGFGDTVGGSGTASCRITRALYFDSALNGSLVSGVSAQLDAEYNTPYITEVPVLLDASIETANDGGSQGASIVQTVPVDAVDGNILLWGVHVGSNLGSVPWPAGWTQVDRPFDPLHPGDPLDTGFITSPGAGATLAVAWRVASSEPADYTMTLAGPEWFVSTMVAVRSGIKGTPVTPGVLPVAVSTSDKTTSYWQDFDPVASPWELHSDYIFVKKAYDLVVLFGAVDNTTSQTGIIYTPRSNAFGQVPSVVENTNYCSLAVVAYVSGEKGWQGNARFFEATGTGVAASLLIAVVLTVP